MLVIPMALQNLITVGLGMADTMMLGRVSGDALSGSALANQIYFVFTLIIFGLSSGASVLTAQYWGKGDTEVINRVMGITVRTSLIAAVAVSAVSMLFPEVLLSFFTNDAAVIATGTEFLRILAISFVFTGFTMTYLNIIRSVEIVRVTMLIYLMSFIINLVLNWVLIFGNLGAPALGVTGSAMATAIARLCELIVTAVYARFFNKRIHFRIKYLFIKGGVLTRDFIRYSTPVVLNEVFWGLGIATQSAILGHISSEAIEANAVARVFHTLSLVVSLGMANATAVVVGKAIGSRDEKFARQAANSLLLTTACVGLLSGGMLAAITPFIISLYPLSQTALDYLFWMLMTMSVFCVFQSFNCCSIIGVMRGGGDAKYGLYIDIGTLWGISLTLGAAGAFLMNWPVPVVFVALLSDEIGKFIFAVRRIASGLWLSRVTRETIE